MKHKQWSVRCFAVAIAMAGAVSMLGTGCSKKAPEGAIATYIIGEVTLERQGEAPRPVRFAERLQRGDVIATGKNSFFAFQIGDEAIIKVQSNTTMRVDAVWDKADNRFSVEQGTMISTVKRLRREATYQVTTKTSLAAVRGTEFSVSYTGGKASVAVNDGKVAVQRITETGPADQPEQIVEKGNAADIDAKTKAIETRAVSKEEDEAFTRSARVQVVTNIEGKNEEELKKIEQQLQEQFQAPQEEKKEDSDKKQGAEQGKDGKAADTAVKKDEKKEDKKQNGKDSEAANDDNKAIASTDKPVYASNDTITVSYQDMPESRNAWIALAKAGTDGRQYVTFQWTYGNKQGTMSFPSLKLEPGNYEVQLHYSRSNWVNKRIPFKVQ